MNNNRVYGCYLIRLYKINKSTSSFSLITPTIHIIRAETKNEYQASWPTPQDDIQAVVTYSTEKRIPNQYFDMPEADKETLTHHEENELELVFVARVIC